MTKLPHTLKKILGWPIQAFFWLEWGCCHLARDRPTCAAFSKERLMKFVNATKLNRESGAAEGSAVL